MTDHRKRGRARAQAKSRHDSMKRMPKPYTFKDSDEYAAEISSTFGPPVQAPVHTRESSKRKMESATDVGAEARGQSRWLGYTALAAAILSMFMFPVTLGTAAIVIGGLSYMRGIRALGVWSVILGLISLAGYFLLLPLYS
ncbi:hypothetical protein GCM10023310_41640 [Paenibacillus vulneris]|uniref:DUF4190 domain-containing protein n=1 Tax=Paenibacillus vulneris TaxID=1133364 RepID=A0ABW3URM3_9BACL|nr:MULTISPECIES: hypothetical protein [unclassified Paenibacillus]MBE1443257.1 hypothetical protein [Paenibacillus sp. OAS669]